MNSVNLCLPVYEGLIKSSRLLLSPVSLGNASVQRGVQDQNTNIRFIDNATLPDFGG